MKKIKILTLVVILSILSVDALAAIEQSKFRQWRSRKHQTHQVHQRQKHIQTTPPSGTPVGAPLDGGLLILLGASGFSYFGLRKKKLDKNK